MFRVLKQAAPEIFFQNSVEIEKWAQTEGVALGMDPPSCSVAVLLRLVVSF